MEHSYGKSMRTLVNAVSLLLALTCSTALFAAPNEKNSAGFLSSHSKQVSQEKIDQEISQIAQKTNTRPVEEAISAVHETQNALQYLNHNQADEAKSALERALGKLDVVLANHPPASWVPLGVNIQILDTPADPGTINQVSKETKDLLKQGRLQEARHQLRDLASEIEVSTTNLPVTSYPAAIRSASHSLEQGKNEIAKAILRNALQSFVVVESSIPLPIVRAQALVEEVSRQTSAGQMNPAQVDRLLSEADQQLTVAEKLGYGNRKKDFSEIHMALKDTKKRVSHHQESKEGLEKVRKTLQALKDQVSQSPTGSA